MLRVGEAKVRAELARLAKDYGLEIDVGCDRRRSLRRPAAARRDPEGALSRRRHPHPRRADRRAHAARGRCAVRAASLAQGAGQDRHPHHPQAARDHGDHGSRLGHAPRRDGGDPRDGRDLAAGTRGADGRPARAAARREGRAGARRAAARDRQPLRRRCARRAARRQRLLHGSCGRDRRHRGRRRQRPERTAGGASPACASPCSARIRLEGRTIPSSRAQPASHAPARPAARAGGPAAHGACAGLPGLRERDPRLQRRAAARPRAAPRPRPPDRRSRRRRWSSTTCARRRRG